MLSRILMKINKAFKISITLVIELKSKYNTVDFVIHLTFFKWEGIFICCFLKKMFYGPSCVYSYLTSKCPFSKSKWFLKYLDHYRQQLFKSQMDKHHFALESQISHGSVKFYVILFSRIFYFLILYIYLILVCCYCFWIKLWVSNFFADVLFIFAS